MTQGVTVARTGHTLATHVRLADTFWTRFKGLMGTPSLPVGQGLLILPCNSVHCFGMRYPIDVVYIDRAYAVLRVARELAPGKVGPLVKGARAVLELPAGTARDVVEGDRLVGLPPL